MVCHFLLKSLKTSTSIKIASGYIGIDVFKKTDLLLRKIVENGGVVSMVMTNEVIYSVDTEHDRKVVEAKMANDRLINLYSDK